MWVCVHLEKCMRIIKTALLIADNLTQGSFRFSPVILRAPHHGCQKIDDIFVLFSRIFSKRRILLQRRKNFDLPDTKCPRQKDSDVTLELDSWLLVWKCYITFHSLLPMLRAHFYKRFFGCNLQIFLISVFVPWSLGSIQWKHYGFVKHGFCTKLVCLSKLVFVEASVFVLCDWRLQGH